MEPHTDRARAESFGPVADQYDRYRPRYPKELLTAMLEASSGSK
ncbi:SAM-dependent methyltransferase, partial [Burkholderia multivorans]